MLPLVNQHASVDGPTPAHVWAIEIGFSRLSEKKVIKLKCSWGSGGLDPGGVRGRSGDGYEQNTLEACMKLSTR